MELVGEKENVAKMLAQLPKIRIPNDILKEALEKVLIEFNELGATDQVAKGSELVGRLLS